MDWASQPNPFRSYHDAPERLLPRPGAGHALADLLRYSLGLSAWKEFRGARWSLRVNPSSGNLHPTEAYVVAGPEWGLATTPALFHYAPDRHALEQRCALSAFARGSLQATADEPPSLLDGDFLIALTSIHWREAWKYGERAFRYCQHDLGHAIAAIRIAAALSGRHARILSDWSHADIASLTGIDRDEDFVDAEREEPACVILVGADQRVGPEIVDRTARADTRVRPYSIERMPFLDAVRNGVWTGRASQLSEDHVQWTFIDDVAAATRDAGRVIARARPVAARDAPYPAHLLLQRRSALALDGHSSIPAAAFMAMLSRVIPDDSPPWDAFWWDARIHLVLFVHRVDGVDAGLYVLVRNPEATDRLRAACGREFLWERADDALPLMRLARGDCRRLAARVSCDQDIAADGFFSLGMLAEFDRSLEELGPSFYRHLFWESGVVGQILYLEAEAAGCRGTGIGCFYDDPVHDVLGLKGHAFQSLYHFTIGMPIEDTRLTTARGYPWEE